MNNQYTYSNFIKEELWQIKTNSRLSMRTAQQRCISLTHQVTVIESFLRILHPRKKAAQFTHHNTCLRVDKTDKIARIGVFIISWLLGLILVPRIVDEFSGSQFLKDNIWIVMALGGVSFIGAVASILFLPNKNKWQWHVMRYIGLSGSVWYATGALYHIYAIFKGYAPMTRLMEHTMQERLVFVFGLGFFVIIMHERWKAKRL